MTIFHPKVSIIIPVFNGEKYLKEAIESALNQTYDNCEVIIINDGSTDRTEQIAEFYGDKIRYFYKKNGGQSSALNYGIEKMNGEYFSWLSHDDIYYPNKIETQILFLNNLLNRDKIVLYSDYEVINYKSIKICDVKVRDSNPNLFRYRLLISSPINGCTVLIPKVAFYEVGFFNLERPHTSDYELFFKMADKYSFIHIPEVLVKSRTHKDQMTFVKASYHKYESNLFLLFGLNNISTSELLATGEKYPIIYLQIAKSWSKRGYYNAFKSALKAFHQANGKLSKLIKSVIICYLLYLKKTINDFGKSILYKFIEW